MQDAYDVCGVVFQRRVLRWLANLESDMLRQPRADSEVDEAERNNEMIDDERPTVTASPTRTTTPTTTTTTTTRTTNAGDEHGDSD